MNMVRQDKSSDVSLSSRKYKMKQHDNRTAVGTIFEEMFGKTSRFKHFRLTFARMLRAEQEHLL